MKTPSIFLKLTLVVALLAVIAGCASYNQSRENALIAAGFKAKIASTPQQQKHLLSLPSGRITLVNWKGKPYYVYPDKANNTAYVGTPDQYQAYQQLRIAKQISDNNLQAAEINNQQAISDQDMMMTWGAWGPGFWY